MANTHKAFEGLTWTQCLVIQDILCGRLRARGENARALAGLMGRRNPPIAKTRSGYMLTPLGIETLQRLADWRPDKFSTKGTR